MILIIDNSELNEILASLAYFSSTILKNHVAHDCNSVNKKKAVNIISIVTYNALTCFDLS